MTQSTGKVRIGYLFNLGYFPYWAAFAQGVHARAAELGAELCLPTSDPDEEIAAATQEVLGQRPDALIVQHSVSASLPDVAEALADVRCPVIGGETAVGAPYTCSVRADEAAGTRLVVTQLFELLGGQRKVVNIAGANLTDRQRVFHELLQGRGGVELAYEGFGMWDRESGARVMREAIATGAKLSGVFAHNDQMAAGACDVIAEHGLEGQITVVGFDADPEGLIAISEGRMAATVYRGIYGIGRQCVDAALRAATGERLPSEQLVPVKLITAANLAEATLDSTLILPRLLRDLVASNRAQRKLSEATIMAQRSLIRELSTPVIPITESILVMPLVGAIDTMRAQQILETVLEAIAQRNAKALIIDITGIAVVDTGVAHYILQAAQAVRLLGARVVLVGIRPEVAQTMVGLGISFGEIITRATLQDGFAYAQRMLQ